MKSKNEIEKIKTMNDKELFRLVRENNKAQNDKRYFKENFEKFQKLYHDLIWKKENKPNDFVFEQNKAAFSKASSWTQRIIFIIKTENKFLTSEEICAIAYNYNHALVMHWKYPLATLRQNIHLVVGYGLVKSVHFRGRRSHYYGLPTFYDSLGEIKIEYKEILDNL